jgi:hypothetical protein
LFFIGIRPLAFHGMHASSILTVNSYWHVLMRVVLQSPVRRSLEIYCNLLLGRAIADGFSDGKADCIAEKVMWFNGMPFSLMIEWE